MNPRAALVLATATATVVVAVSACGSSGEDPGSRRVPGRDDPARPIIVAPKVAPPDVETPPIAAPRVRLAPTLPPVLRGPRQVDVYTQDQAIVDVLWIVDNSGTLANERMRLAAQFDRFLAVLLAAEVDFHVGVTSTDLSSRGDQGRLRGPLPYLDRNTRDAQRVFREAVTFPEDSTVSGEQGLAAMTRALTPPLSDGPNRGFLRDEAALAVIAVSDEDDVSPAPAAFYSRLLEGLKGPGREANVSLSAVVGPSPDGCTPAGEEHIFGAEAKAGDRYIEVANAVGGLVESICTLDFAPFVDQLARALSGLRRFFPLSAPPAADSIAVKVDGAQVPRDEANGWSYRESSRAIVFNGAGVPPPGAEIEIAYDVDL